MKIVCRKVGRSLVPVDDEGFDALAKVKDGRDVKVTISISRNVRHHRLFFAIIKFVKMHSPKLADHSVDQIKTALKLATGHVETFVDCQTGQTAWVPKSMAFDSMDQTEFEKFFQSACDVVAKRWMPEGTTPEDVRRELILMVDGRHALGERAERIARAAIAKATGERE